jgi:hypothetical protein
VSSDSGDVREVRLARNQSLFRSVNERVEKVAQQYTALAPLGFICECAITDCGSHLELTRDEYDEIRKHPTRFFVLPDHVFPEVEVVVEDREQYVIVEKIGRAGRVAAAADVRQAPINDVL